MAHKTLISGTAYSVTGGRELIGGTGYDCKAGKTLIGGTAYSVVATREVENSKLISGRVTSRTVGDYYNVTVTISNSNFDWSKFGVNMLMLKADEILSDYARIISLALAGNQLICSSVSGNGVVSSATLDTSTNGVLKITTTFSGNFQHTCPPFDWWIALEAKT